MGFITETRTSLENPQTPLSYPAEWLLDIFNGGRTDSGTRVSEMVALQVVAVYACVEIKAGAIGFLDLPVFERTVNDKGRVSHRRAYEHDLYDLLEHEPNPEMSSFTMRKTVQAHRMLWGNGYIEIERNGGNGVAALWPRNPARTRPRRVTQKMEIAGELVLPGQVVFGTTEGREEGNMNPEAPVQNPNNKAERLILAADMIHLPGLALDGRLGQSVIQLGRQAVGLALATEKFGAKFFGNGAVASGIFKVPNVMAPEERDEFVKSMREAYGGENLLRPMLLEAGTDYTPTMVQPNDAQFLETREFQAVEVCRLFGVPPHMVGITEKTNRANTEQIGLEFVTFGLNPDLSLWKQELKRKLFPKADFGRNAKRHFSAIFDTSPLTMPDADSRRNFYASGFQGSWLSANDIREREHLNPIEDESADSYWVQINMQPAKHAFENPLGADAGAADPNADPAKDTAKDPAKKGKNARAIAASVFVYKRLFRDAFGRVCSREKIDIETLRRAFLPVFLTIGEELEQQAAEEFSAQPDPEAFASSRFLADYTEGMLRRVAAWKGANGHALELADEELERAVRAIAIEIYRSIGTRVAKKKTEAEPVNA